MNKDVIIGIDAGTSVLKAVAFSIDGKELANTSTPNVFNISDDGKATQSPKETWKKCVKIISDLCLKLPGLVNRTLIVSITGQGDGTWLVDKDGEPTCDAWLWMDSRSAKIAKNLSLLPTEEARFNATGTGMFAGQQGSQMNYIESSSPNILNKSETAFHCKDYLYMKLTDVRATDPSEACMSFGNFRTRNYDDEVIKNIGLEKRKFLLPNIIDGSKETHPLSDNAAKITGLKAGTPVSLAYLDGLCSFLGSGGYDPIKKVGNTVIGTTGVHMKSSSVSEVSLDLDSKSGYTLVLPIPDQILQLQTNMSGSLNIDWLSSVALDLFKEFDIKITSEDLIFRIDQWLKSTKPGKILYHPYISDAGERGPFIDNFARASIIGLTSSHRFPDIMRAVIEGLCMASRDCYLAMGTIPSEIRLAGGATKSKVLRKIFSSALKTTIRTSNSKEPGATGAAMIGAMAIGVYEDWEKCISEWVTPLLGEVEEYDADLGNTYDQLFEIYLNSRKNLKPLWPKLSMNNDNK